MGDLPDDRTIPPVLEEVQKQVKSLRDDLKKKLQVLPTTLDNQKKIIK